jgi:hypothetical protein
MIEGVDVGGRSTGNLTGLDLNRTQELPFWLAEVAPGTTAHREGNT